MVNVSAAAGGRSRSRSPAHPIPSVALGALGGQGSPHELHLLGGEGGPATIRARASRRDTLPSLLVLSLDHSGRTVPKQQEFFFFAGGDLQSSSD